MTKKSKKNRKVKQKKSQAAKEWPIESQIYTGPARPGWTLHANHTTVMLLTDNLSLASTAGGVIADVFGSSPSSCPNWADTNTVWGEFRVLAMTIRFAPANRYSKSTTVCMPGVRVQDRRSATALASLDAGTSRETAIITNLEDPWRSEMKMSGSEEAQFQAVSGPTSLFWLKLYFTGLSVSTTYGLIFAEYLVQFRNVE
jgi:hypothetical protein